jgi:hypothetical protein
VTAAGRAAIRICATLAATALLAFMPAPARAIDKNDKTSAKRDRDLFLIRPVVGWSTADLRFEPKRPQTSGGEDHVVTWTPNSAMKVGARAGYGPFLATATVDWRPNDPVETHGESKGVELQFTGTARLDGHEVASTVFFQRYHGFYLSTTQDLFPKAESPLLAPRLSLTTYGVSFLFFTDPDFSYDDAFVEYRPKEHGEASWGFRVAMGHIGFDGNGNALMPGKFAADFNDAFGLNYLDATYASAGIGFGADWRPFGRVLLGLSGFLGATFAATSFRIMGYERYTPAIGPAASLQAVAGWSGDLLHWGLMTTVEQEGLRIEGTSVTAMRSSVLSFLGVTF